MTTTTAIPRKPNRSTSEAATLAGRFRWLVRLVSWIPELADVIAGAIGAVTVLAGVVGIVEWATGSFQAGASVAALIAGVCLLWLAWTWNEDG